MDEAVQGYIDAIPSEHRALFDRLHRLILEAHPDATVALSYGIPAYRVGRRRLFVGVWKHGLSVYGWQADHDAGFSARHPEFLASRRRSGCGHRTPRALRTTNSATSCGRR